MNTIVFANHKGGAAKTTSTHWVAHHLAKRKQHVLLIDLDPQGNLTQMAGYGPPIDGISIDDVLCGREKIAKAIRPARNERICIVPADIRLEYAAAVLTAEPLGFNALSKALASLAPAMYDYVLIDCPPAANILVINALVAATHVIIPADPETHAIDGAERIHQMVGWLQAELGKAPQILGTLATKVNERTNRHVVGLQLLPKPILGKVPLRQGIDADYDISAAYAEATDALLLFLGGDHAGNAA